jgi:hypothetical protein
LSTQITFVVMGQLALVGLVIVAVATRIYQRERARLEMQQRLIERFTSAAELQQFLETEGGRRLLEMLDPVRTLDPVRRGPSGPRNIYVVQAGVILGAVGAALLLLVVLRPLLGGAIAAEDAPAILVAAIMVLALSGGLLLAATVARRLARSWGLEHPHPPAEEDRR